MEKAIGIFDSGIGGLTVLKEIMKILPNEDFIYLGDTARVPYGIRSPETILKYSYANADFLMHKDIKVLVIACNTASSISTESLKERFKIPVIEVITPGAKSAIKATRNGKVGIIGTEATIKSGSYYRTLKSLNPNIEVYSQACPLFVPLVEEGWTDEDNKVSLMVAEKYLKGLKEKGIDTLILGCTHYPLLKDVIRKVIGVDICLVDSAQETAKELKKLMHDKQLFRFSVKKGNLQIYVTDDPERFKKIGFRFLGFDIEEVRLIEIVP